MPRPLRDPDRYELKRRPGHKVWYVYWRANKVRRWRSTGTTNLCKARATLSRFVPPPPEDDRSDRQLVYFIQCATRGTLKIGVAVSPARRLGELQVGSPHRLKLLATMPGGKAMEKALHAAFARHKLEGEWFSPAPNLMRVVRHLARIGTDSNSETSKNLGVP